jgi:hypothetical protein
MGKIYTVDIKNIYSEEIYSITSFGDDPRDVHKYVLTKSISRNEEIDKIYTEDRCVFDNKKGFIPKR